MLNVVGRDGLEVEPVLPEPFARFLANIIRSAFRDVLQFRGFELVRI